MGQSLINGIKDFFNSPDELNHAIDLQSLMPISLSAAKNDPQLKRFFWLDEDGPFSEIIQRGAQSVRKGLYKIQSQPYYRTNFFPGTFAATVYYWNQENENLIKYHANIGPITNTSMLPLPFNDDTIKHFRQIPILNKFYQDKATHGYADDYKIAKENFFDSVFKEERIIIVYDSQWDPAFPTIRKKQVKWSFIDY